MKTFKEYIEEKEIINENNIAKEISKLEKLNRQAKKEADLQWKLDNMKTPDEVFNGEMASKKAFETLGHGLGGIATAAASAWVLSVLFKYGRSFLGNVFGNFGVTKDGFLGKIKSLSNKPSLKEVNSKVETANKKFENELADIYEAIKSKDWEKAKNEYNSLTIELKKTPGVTQAIIEKIIEVCKEPPIYISSPGNITYKAIKKVLGQQIANASAKTFAEKINELGE